MGAGSRLAIASVGTLIYGSAGATIGAMNARWFDLTRAANAMLPLMGIGAALVLFAFYRSDLHVRLKEEAGGLGVAVRILLLIGVVFFVSQPVLEFAILGTFGLGLGLVCLAVAVWLDQLVPVLDRVLITLSAVGSLTWNTETTSAFLLVGVAFLWIVLSLRLLRHPEVAVAESAL